MFVHSVEHISHSMVRFWITFYGRALVGLFYDLMRIHLWLIWVIMMQQQQQRRHHRPSTFHSLVSVFNVDRSTRRVNAVLRRSASHVCLRKRSFVERFLCAFRCYAWPYGMSAKTHNEHEHIHKSTIMWENEVYFTRNSRASRASECIQHARDRCRRRRSASRQTRFFYSFFFSRSAFSVCSLAQSQRRNGK